MNSLSERLKDIVVDPNGDSADYLVETLDDAINLLFGGARQTSSDALYGERSDLADPDPRSLRQARSVTLKSEGKARAGFLTA